MPPDARKQAGLSKKEVTLVGGGRREFEVWDRGALRGVRADARQDALPTLFDKLSGPRESSGSRSCPRRRGRVSPAAARRGLGDRRDGGDGRSRGGDAGTERQRAYGCSAWTSIPRRSREAGARLARVRRPRPPGRTRASATSSAVAAARGCRRAPSSILLDLGVSSWQLERVGPRILLSADDEPLDMRLDPTRRRDGGRPAEPAAGGRPGAPPLRVRRGARTRAGSRGRSSAAARSPRPATSSPPSGRRCRARRGRAGSTSRRARFRPCAWRSTTSRAPSARRWTQAPRLLAARWATAASSRFIRAKIAS